ncbi:MAG: two-component regulator propeller domain-containing protein [Saprospiraceae bacterium]
MQVLFLLTRFLLDVPGLIKSSIRSYHSTLVVRISLIFLCHATLYGQNHDIYFKHYNFQNGLSGPVTTVVQDHVGFIWLGTTDGLNRFDGKNFTVFRNIPGDSNSLSNNLINDLHVDSINNIWIATNGGLCYYSNRDQRFHSLDIPDSIDVNDRYRIYALAGSTPGGIWFATKSKIHYWSEQYQKLESYALPEGPNLHISSLYLDIHDKLWIGTNQTIVYLFDPVKKTMTPGPIISVYASKLNLSITITSFMPIDGDTLLAGAWYGGLQKIYSHNGQIFSSEVINEIESDHKKNIVKGIWPGENNTYWIGTYGSGLELYDHKTNQFIKCYRHQENNIHSLSNDYINDVLVDARGILWIGNEFGLDQYNPEADQFKLIKIETQTKETSIVRTPSAISQDKNDPFKLWISISGIGLFSVDRKTSKCSPYPLPQTSARTMDKNIYSIYSDPNGILWLGTRTGLFCFDPVKNKLWLPYPEDSLIPRGVHQIVEDPKGKMWFATNLNGIYCLDKKKSTWIHYSYQPGNPNSLPDNRIFCMIQDHAGKIWIGTQNKGLCSLHPESGKMVTYEHKKNDMSSLPDNNVYDIYEDASYNLWIATENGLASLDSNRTKIQSLGIQEGLSNNIIFSITPDHKGTLWLATNNGLSNFDIPKKKFKNYFIPLGLPNTRMDGASLITSDGQLYFSTSNYLITCDPESLVQKKHLPGIEVTGIKLFDHPLHYYKTNDQISPIQLKYFEDMLSFEFVSLNFNSPESNQYSYKLGGMEPDWMYCGSRQSVTYTNLPGGHYQFVARALNPNGEWSESRPVMIEITPPFWYSWWFISLLLLILGTILYSLFRFRINQILRLQKIRLNIARDLHDEIGSTLSSIHMVSTVSENHNQAEKNQDSFKMISKASGQVMELLHEIVWSITPLNDSMEMMIVHMKQFTSEILEPVNINFDFVTTGDFEKEIIPLHKRKDFYLIFKEAINNMSKYSGASMATIELSKLNKTLSLKISDNGCGIDLTHNSSGNGIKNMIARAKTIHAIFNIESRPGDGTMIRLELPLSHN